MSRCEALATVSAFRQWAHGRATSEFVYASVELVEGRFARQARH